MSRRMLKIVLVLCLVPQHGFARDKDKDEKQAMAVLSNVLDVMNASEPATNLRLPYQRQVHEVGFRIDGARTNGSWSEQKYSRWHETPGRKGRLTLHWNSESRSGSATLQDIEYRGDARRPKPVINNRKRLKKKPGWALETEIAREDSGRVLMGKRTTSILRQVAKDAGEPAMKRGLVAFFASTWAAITDWRLQPAGKRNWVNYRLPNKMSAALERGEVFTLVKALSRTSHQQLPHLAPGSRPKTETTRTRDYFVAIANPAKKASKRLRISRALYRSLKARSRAVAH
jgi:hypothetical protein